MTKPPPPDDVAAWFDLPPPAAAQSSAEAADALEALDAAEAALAAELAAEIGHGGVAADAPDSRTDLRVQVAWPARMQLQDGQVIDLQVRNISERGVGLVSAEHMPANTVVHFEMDVPPLGAGGATTLVKGVIQTTYTVARGAEILCGGTWQVPPDDLELVNRWIQGLRR